MKCPVCGTANEAGAVFCYNCGSSLQTENAPAPPATGRTTDLSRDQRSDREQPRAVMEEPYTPPEHRSGPPPGNPFARPVTSEPPSLPLEGNARVYPAAPAASPYVMSAPPVISQTSNLAMFSLVFGILAWTILPLVAAIGAIITGHMAQREIRESGGRFSGGGLAMAGLILGYINLVGVVLLFIAFCSIFGLLVPAFGTSGP